MTKIGSSPRTVRLMTALVLLATFAAGTVTGGGLVHWFASDSGPSHPMLPPILPLHELNLSEAQEKKVHEIFERYRPKLDALLNETFPKVRAINEQIERDVRGVLTDEQRHALDRSKSQRQGRRRDGPPHDGLLPPRPHGAPGDWPPGAFHQGPHLEPPPAAPPSPLPAVTASVMIAPAPVPPATTGR